MAKKSKSNNNLILSYELTLPQRIYCQLDRLFIVFKHGVRTCLEVFWNEAIFNLLGQDKQQKQSACAVLKSLFPNTGINLGYLPSRVLRNILEQTGEIIRTQGNRKKIFDYIVKDPEVRVQEDSKVIAQRLGESTLMVLNVQRQIQRLMKKDALIADYFKVTRPSFDGNVVITTADDNIKTGQFKRLIVDLQKNLVIFKIKVPDRGTWKWIKVRHFIPDNLKVALLTGGQVQAPLIKKITLKSGFTIYKLVIPVEFKLKSLDTTVLRVFSTDLSPSETRLAVAVIVDKEGYSRPVFFKATRLIKKIERILTEISHLEAKIDNIRFQLTYTISKTHRDLLKVRLNHLFQEQKLKWYKVKNLRKGILEIFTNEIITLAKIYGCTHIAIENLKFKNLPSWRNSKFRRHFSEWFYSKVETKLEYKAKKHGLRFITVSSYKNSTICHSCGKETKPDGLTFVCSHCGEKFDRDYNASVNIGIKALNQLLKKNNKDIVGGTKPVVYMTEGNPGRIPFRRGLAHFKAPLTVFSLLTLMAYIKVVEISTLKFRNLTKWISLDKSG